RERLARAGLSASSVRFSWRGPLELTGVGGTTHGVRVSVDTVEVGWYLAGGTAARAHVSSVGLRGLRVDRAPLQVEWPKADFDVEWTPGAEGVTFRQRDGRGQVEAVRSETGESTLTLADLDLSGAEIRWNGDGAMTPGRWS